MRAYFKHLKCIQNFLLKPISKRERQSDYRVRFMSKHVQHCTRTGMKRKIATEVILQYAQVFLHPVIFSIRIIKLKTFYSESSK